MLFALSLLTAATVQADNYAVLVAGSKTYGNYRHQADVCHAYQILIKNGINPANIITMSYNDVAKSSSNPYPNKLFNKPTDAGDAGVDVNEGCMIDYEGNDVTPKNFMKVLTGDASAGGKVLKSTSADNVFVNFVDHGGVGIIAFPTGELLHADDLIASLTTMHTKNMYKELVFYMEACESGSMFDGLLPPDIKIYATTASNAKESSWGTYCPPSDKVNGKSLNTCLGDLYSVNWMEDADVHTPKETLDAQLKTVTAKTNKSHVMQYGESDMGSDEADYFWGKVSQKAASYGQQKNETSDLKTVSAIDSRDVQLHTKYSQYLNSDSTDQFERARLAKALIDEIQAREFADKIFSEIASRSMVEQPTLLNDIMTAHKRPTLFKCHKALTQAVQAHCGGFTDYSLKHMRVLVNLCEAKKSADTIVPVIKAICQA